MSKNNLKEFKKIIAVLNDFSLIDDILKKTSSFSKKYHASVEILYVHERPLFAIPDFFRSSEKELPLDKEKIKATIVEKVSAYDFETTPVVFVKIDDTPDRVWALAREDKETFVITGYHKDITQKLVNKISQPILVLKNHTDSYQKMGLIINTGSPSKRCIEKAKSYFPHIDIELFYDYRYIVDPSMEASLQNVQIIQDAQKEAFEALKTESGLDGKFFIDGEFLGTQMSEYLQEKNFDILYVCSHPDDFFVSDNLSLTLLEDTTCDILVPKEKL
jgi:nicotinamidase-related amidase